VDEIPAESTDPSLKLAGSLPRFPKRPGSEWTESLALPNFVRKQLIFSRFREPGEVHVYSAHCRAGDRLRVQSLLPILESGGAANVAFAVVAQSLPYSADGQQLPVPLPAGFSAVVAPVPEKLAPPLRDALTWSQVYPGPVLDIHTLVGGRCYIVVWNPRNNMGKYVLQIGHRWSLRWTYWLQLPWFWWKIRGWFGLGRRVAYAAMALLLLLVAWLVRRMTTSRSTR
jgi:hypothetical protein